MATKIIKAWINGAIQEIEIEEMTSPAQPLSIEDRLVELEDKPIVTDGNLLVGNGTTELEEMTPEEALSHINGASVTTLTTAEYEALDEFNANTLYMLTDAEDNCAYIDIEDNSVDVETGLTLTEVNDKVEELQETINNYQYGLTDEEKQEIVDIVKAEVPLVKVVEQPTFVNSIEECIDTSKTYILPDGFLWAYKTTIAKRVTPLTSEDFVAANVNTDGTLNAVSSSKIRIATSELLSLSGDLLCINCPTPYQYIVYFYSGNAESTYIGKTGFKSGGIANILNETVSSGTIEGAKYCRIALRDSTDSSAILTDRIDEFMSAISVEYISVEKEEISEWTNTGFSYNQPADYEERLVALEKLIGGLENGTY